MTHELQHARLPCPSLSPRVCSNWFPLNPWCHPIISSSVIPFSSCPQSFWASWSFPVNQFFGIRWPKYWSFSISPSRKYSRLISFRIEIRYWLFWIVLLWIFWYLSFEEYIWEPCIWYPVLWQRDCLTLVDRFCYTVDSAKVVPLDIRDVWSMENN